MTIEYIIGFTRAAVQERLAEINAERAAKKLAAHVAAEQRLKEAAMPPRMQLAAQVVQAVVGLTF